MYVDCVCTNQKFMVQTTVFHHSRNFINVWDGMYLHDVSFGFGLHEQGSNCVFLRRVIFKSTYPFKIIVTLKENNT